MTCSNASFELPNFRPVVGVAGDEGCFTTVCIISDALLSRGHLFFETFGAKNGKVIHCGRKGTIHPYQVACED